MPSTHSIDSLESAVLGRIARRRAESNERLTISTSTLLVIAALAAGIVIGFGRAEHADVTSGGSESVVLADSARMAPSGLLADAQ